MIKDIRDYNLDNNKNKKEKKIMEQNTKNYQLNKKIKPSSLKNYFRTVSLMNNIKKQIPHIKLKKQL